MTELEYTLSFNTPAFLGNALQQAQWRTPPIKALIRQWWRVVQKVRTDAEHRHVDQARMRHQEGLLFGNAWLKDKDDKTALHCKSRLLLRLAPQLKGDLSTEKWPADFDTVATSREARLRADLYTGYGPVLSEKAASGARRIAIPRGAIKQGQSVTLRLRFSEPIEGLHEALRLIHWFGALGSRSRNGWGSVRLEAANDLARNAGLSDAASLCSAFCRDWHECMQLDWPHAIGRDDRGPLVWATDEVDHWRAVIGRLARIRIAVRLAAKCTRDAHSRAGAIHYLGYPAGTGERNPWELTRRDPKSAEPRLASPLRFKVIASGTRLRALVFHMPSMLPDAFTSLIGRPETTWLTDVRNYTNAWEAIHRTLDDNTDPMLADGRSLGLHRLGAGE